MGKKMVINAALVCHKGCERGNNEDNFFFNGDFMPLADMDAGAYIIQSFDAPQQLFAVLDGMGGANRGEKASFMAARRMLDFYGDMKPAAIPQGIDRFAAAASDEISADAAKSGSKVEGTTLSLLAISRQTAYVANVGDSRVYRMRGGQLEQLSHDHSEVNRLRAAGLLTEEEARKSSRSNVITQYVGMSAAERASDFVYQTKTSLKFGDRYLLCTDGASDLIPTSQIEGILQHAKAPADAARMLVHYALEMGGKDNITAIVADAR